MWIKLFVLNRFSQFRRADILWYNSYIIGGGELIVGVYAPNNSKDEFYIELGKKLPDHDFEQMILVGDFNGVIDPSRDKSEKENKF